MSSRQKKYSCTAWNRRARDINLDQQIYTANINNFLVDLICLNSIRFFLSQCHSVAEAFSNHTSRPLGNMNVLHVLSIYLSYCFICALLRIAATAWSSVLVGAVVCFDINVNIWAGARLCECGWQFFDRQPIRNIAVVCDRHTANERSSNKRSDDTTKAKSSTMECSSISYWRCAYECVRLSTLKCEPFRWVYIKRMHFGWRKLSYDRARVQTEKIGG